MSATTMRGVRNGAVACLVAVLALSGCATTSQTFLEQYTAILDSQIKVVNAQVSRIPDLCRVGQFDSGWVKGTGLIGDDSMTVGMTKRLTRLEELCAKPSPTYSEMGEIAALGMRLWADRASIIAQQAILPLLGVAAKGLPFGF